MMRDPEESLMFHPDDLGMCSSMGWPDWFEVLKQHAVLGLASSGPILQLSRNPGEFGTGTTWIVYSPPVKPGFRKAPVDWKSAIVREVRVAATHEVQDAYFDFGEYERRMMALDHISIDRAGNDYRARSFHESVVELRTPDLKISWPIGWSGWSELGKWFSEFTEFLHCRVCDSPQPLPARGLCTKCETELSTDKSGVCPSCGLGFAVPN